jgi:hypothetical protein
MGMKLGLSHKGKNIDCGYPGFEVFIEVTMKSAVFWSVMPSSSGIVRRFGRTYRLHLQGLRTRSVCRILLLVSCLTYSLILKMDATCSFETSGSLGITWSYSLKTLIFID